MKQTQTIISTYTADVSGVCSALFELGGMTVMHDASGCNSTYNTHDEPRWYDQDSLVFISGLSEMEAIMGDDEKLVGDILEAAEQLHPRFIAIAGTPIPMMTGCDIPAIAAEVEARTGIPAFGFQTNGMHSYVSGAGMALAAYGERMTRENAKPEKGTVNLLGVTPLDFSVNGQADSMKELVENGGWRVKSVWAMNSGPEELEAAGEAQVNLVVSSVGLEAARVLRRKFGTPYVVGTPMGERFSQRLLEAMEKAAKENEQEIAFAFAQGEGRGVIIGESVLSRSLAAAISLERGFVPRVICPVECPPALLSPADLALADEVDIIQALKGAEIVISDPLYRPIVPKECRFYPLPHEAFSGRLYRKDIPNLIGKKL